MFKIMAFLKKNSELSDTEFIEYYETKHVPLILSLTHTPVVYKRNYLKRDNPFGIHGAAIAFDVITEQVFKSREDLDDWLSHLSKPEVAQLVRSDEERFLDHSHYFAYVIDERVTSANYPTK